MATHNRVLILFVHPSPHRSQANIKLFHAAQHTPQVTAVDLYQEYPTYFINIEREQQRLREHDVVVFLFPLYWYSTPSILKQWQDLVLEHGFVYGHKGMALHGKQLLCAVTTGGAETAYQGEMAGHASIRQLLQPIEHTAKLIGMHYLPPFTLFSARTAKDQGRLEQHISHWQNLLTHLVTTGIHPEALAGDNTLNSYVAALKEQTL